MQITSETKTVSELFPIEGNLTHRIPIYQRSYSWSNANIDDLFTDVINESSHYYMGNLLVQQSEDDQNQYDIVDGQQRLTTIALIMLACYERLSILRDDYSNDKKTLYMMDVQMGDIQRKLRKSDLSPRITLLDDDQVVLENYINAILDDETRGKYGNRTIAKRYKYILDQLISSLDTPNDILNFLNKLNDVELLRITVTKTADAYTVFSSLNSKGAPLTLLDLIKTDYLNLSSSKNDKDVDTQYQEKWDTLMSIFSDDDSVINTTAVTQFLLNNYDAFIERSNKSITKKESLTKYKRLFKDLGPEYIDELIENARIFTHISKLVDNSPLSDHLLPINNNIDTLLGNLRKIRCDPSIPYSATATKGICAS